MSSFIYFLRFLKHTQNGHYYVSIHRGDETGPQLALVDVGTDEAKAIDILYEIYDDLNAHIKATEAKLAQYSNYYRN